MANFDGFSLTVPSNTSSAALGDDEFRSVKSYLQNWFEEEHYATDGSAASAGVHKAGTARAYSQSAAPTAVNIGELWHDSDDDTFHVAEAAGTGNWTQVTASVTLSSVNTWTALNNFSSNLTTADITVTGAVDRVLGAKATLDFPSIAAGGADALTIAVTGATVGSPVIVGWTQQNINGMIPRGYVSAAGTVTVVVNNTGIGAINLDSQEFAVTVFNKIP